MEALVGGGRTAFPNLDRPQVSQVSQVSKQVKFMPDQMVCVFLASTSPCLTGLVLRM